MSSVSFCDSICEHTVNSPPHVYLDMESMSMLIMVIIDTLTFVHSDSMLTHLYSLSNIQELAQYAISISCSLCVHCAVFFSHQVTSRGRGGEGRKWGYSELAS